MLNIDEVNSLCQDIAEVTLENMVDDYYDQLEQETTDNYILALGSRLCGPDYDAGGDDSSGLFYWDEVSTH